MSEPQTITPAALAAHQAAHDRALADLRAGGSKDAYNAHLATLLAALRCKVVEPAPPSPAAGVRKRDRK